MGPLANLFSTIDSTKRKIGGLLDNPLGTFQQLIGQMQDYRREDARLGDIAYGDPRKGEPLVKNEQAFNQLTQRAFDNLMSFAPAGITVWHGSPHKFDKFDASKIGTGSGYDAQGTGLYLSDADRVGEAYAGDKGYLYKVDLPDDAVEKMLRWQEKVKDQPRTVREAILKTVGRDGYKAAIKFDATGQDIYDNALASLSSREAADALRANGIPGIRYKGNATTNTVVFPGNEGLLSILERNGQPLR